MSKVITVTLTFNVDDSVELDTLRGDVVEVVESAILDGELFADNDAGVRDFIVHPLVVRDFIVHPLVIKQLIEQD